MVILEGKDFMKNLFVYFTIKWRLYERGARYGAVAYRSNEGPDESECVAVPLGVSTAISAKGPTG